MLAALGVEPSLFVSLLKVVVSAVFGLLGFIAFIIFLIGIFRRFTATNIEVDRKKQSVIMALISGLLFVFFIFLWIVLYFYLSQISIGGQGSATILSNPESTLNLTAPIAITFTAREIEKFEAQQGVTVTSYAWDLDGDGKFNDGSGRDIQHTYDQDGVFKVATKILLSSGKEMSLEHLVTIANVLPKASISYDPQTLEVPASLTLDASDSVDPDGNIISYDWDFESDGIVDAQGKIVKHTFSEAKLTTVTLALTDNSGATLKQSLDLLFQPGKEKKATIVVRPGATGEAPFFASFDGSASFINEKIQLYDWDFGDSSTPLQGRQVQHSYTTPGDYIVKLSVEGQSGKRFETEEKITVEKKKIPPKAIIQVKNQVVAGNALTGKAPLSVQVSGALSKDTDGRVQEYHWDFTGDGKDDAVGPEATTTFAVPGSYEIALTVIDDDDLKGEARLPVTVISPGVVATVQASTLSGSSPLEVTLDGSASRADEGAIISYTWNFGDKSPEIIAGAKQTHVFSDVGEHIVTLTVLTDQGKKASTKLTLVVRDSELQADFTMSPKEPTAGEKVFFDASASLGDIARYYFDFGDGAISRVVKPDHTYEKANTYTVTLEVTDRKNRVSRKQLDISIPAE